MQNFITIFHYEWKKIWMSKVTLIAFAILFGFSLLQGVMEIKGNYPEESLKQFGQIDGRQLDDDLLKDLYSSADEYGTFWNETNFTYMELCDYVREIVDYGTPIADHDAADVYEKRKDSIEEAKALCVLSEKEKEYWSEQKELINEPFIWRDAVVEKELLNALSNVMIMLGFFLPLALSGVFALEYSAKTHNQLRASKHGRLMVYGAKVLAATLTTLLSYAAFAGGTIFTASLYWHLDAVDAIVQIVFPFSEMNLNLGQLIGIIMLLLFTASLLFGAFTIVLSEVMHNVLAVMGTCIGGYFGIFALSVSIPTAARGLSQAFSLFPATLVSPRLVYEYRLVPVFGHLVACYQFAPVLYVTIAALLLILGGVLYNGPGRRG